MAQTFYEMLNTVAFRNLAGRVSGEKDLWALRDLLFETKCTMEDTFAEAYDTLRKLSMHKSADDLVNANKILMGMLEKDIQTIERYCKHRGIIRPTI